MNLFKSSKVNLHPMEKIGILLTTGFTSFVFFIFGKAILHITDNWQGNVSGYGLMVTSIVLMCLVYTALHGKGMNREVK
ncbi:hypothetical protein AF332_11845 [Sporosarcina globispora]|uniref:Uncharacterized protein n=1 Tax=Sporosarcina globispora TaxID=1459 RepID=A0A0M0GDG1_SPOGL|nr:hypothetical protein [Sporosarcina globispora]KON87451.1 hypothetical protein AF332_11845 [Sporosarcina globispora]